MSFEGHRHFSSILRASSAMTAISLLAATPVLALPQDGQVVGGQASIATSGSQTTITQSTHRGIINWQSFDIGAGEHVQFIQPSSTSVTLNRVTGGSVSQILGNLTANGTVMIVNPQGTFIGPNASVNAGSLLISASDIANNRFMAGDYHFDMPGDPNAAIINTGGITVAEGGLAAFVAPNVINDGLIQAKLGRVQLASGNSFTLDLYGDGLINLEASDAITSQLVSNGGIVATEGGKVLLTAAAATEVVNSLINMDGIISATSIGEQNGEIVIFAEGSNAVTGNDAEKKSQKSGSSTVLVSGILDASGYNSGAKGGEIQILADHVGLLSGAMVDASGSQGGGDIRIGGDYLGQSDAPTALRTILQGGTIVTANAVDAGDGGSVILWADDRTDFAGRIEAQGGIYGGNGGFVEVSGKATLDYTGLTDLRGGAGGRMGSLLLDPRNIYITNDTTSGVNTGTTFTPTGDYSILNVDTLVTQLGLGNVIIETGADGSQAGNIGILASITQTHTDSGSLTLNAANNILIGADIDIYGKLTVVTSGNGEFIMGADVGSGNGVAITARGGFESTGTGVSYLTGSITTYGQPIRFAGDVQIANFHAAPDTNPIRISTAGGGQAGGNLVFDGTLDAYAGTLGDYALLFANRLYNANSGPQAVELSKIEQGGVTYIVHQYKTTGTSLFLAQAGVSEAEYLVVAGGGGAGRGGNDGGGGGGGAGGFRTNVNDQPFALDATAYQVVVGAGGLASASSTLPGSQGSNSSAFGAVAIGGGGGRSSSQLNTTGLLGGSGGGGAQQGTGGAGTAGQGFAGGNGASSGTNGLRSGGGGGGAGSAGTNAQPGIGGNGGDGLMSSITGSDIYYAGGGGGGSRSGTSGGSGGLGGGGHGALDLVNAQNGQANTGGGGGASARGTSGNGGSGIVVIRHGVADASQPAGNHLELNAGSGTVTLTGNIGQATPLGALSVTSGTSLVLPSINASSLLVHTTGGISDIMLNGTITVSGPGNALILAAGRDIINNAGSSALYTPSGRWLVYSTNPANDTIGGLTNDFRRFSCTYGGSCPAFPAGGNGFLYSYTPTLTATPSALAGITYGDAAPNLSGYAYTLSGYLDSDAASDSVAGSLNGSTSYAAGSNVGVYAINYANGTLTSAMGYEFTYTDNLSGIDVGRKTLTASLLGPLAKSFDGTTAAPLKSTNFLLSGVLAGDDVTISFPAKGAFSNSEIGTGKAVFVTGLGLLGSDAGNYLLASGSISGPVGVIEASLGAGEVARVQLSPQGAMANTGFTYSPENGHTEFISTPRPGQQDYRGNPETLAPSSSGDRWPSYPGSKPDIWVDRQLQEEFGLPPVL